MSASLLDSIKVHFISLSALGWLLTLIDILIVAVLIYYAFLLIKGTRATRIIYGIILLALILALGRLFQLQTLNWLLSHLTTLILVAIPIVFQPELRRGLERLGRIKIFKPSSFFLEKILKEITEIVLAVCRILVKNKIGALIIIKRKTGLDDIIETGQILNAKLSVKLLLNIFYPGSPLHDGATIISGNKVVAAGCTLPLTEDEKFYMYGTRHRAALGLSEETDAICIVVSEEKKAISLALGGQIKQITDKELEEKLNKLLKEE